MYTVKYSWKHFAITAGCLGIIASGLATCGFTNAESMEKHNARIAQYDEAGNPNVWFTSEISPRSIMVLYNCLQKELPGKVAVKVHSGEKGNQNFLRPEFYRDIVERVNGTVVECNTAYEGARNTTEKHQKHLDNVWKRCFNVDLMDASGPDMVLPVFDGKILQANYVGRNLEQYDSLLVISHFKGHPMGGYGGALKQLSIGCASSAGKSWIHSAGKTLDQGKLWSNLPEQDKFLESMADAASSVVRHFRGNAAYISVMCNLSVDCDCCATAEDPCMNDIGILASVDPVALDRACLDMIYKSKDKGRDHFVERVKSRHGEHTIETAEELGVGTQKYTLINIDNAKG